MTSRQNFASGQTLFPQNGRGRVQSQQFLNRAGWYVRCSRARIMPDPTIVLRAKAEYLEMPGLRLTIPQASRLFDVEPAMCALLLDALVQEGFLARQDNRYARANRGRCAA